MPEVPEDVISFDIADLTIDEIEMIEDATNTAFDELFKARAKKAGALRAIAWVVKRRDNPDFTLAQAGALKMSLEQDDESPTDASDD